MNDEGDDDRTTRARIDAWARRAAAANGFAEADRPPGALEIKLRAKARRAAAQTGDEAAWSRQALEDRLIRDHALW